MRIDCHLEKGGQSERWAAPGAAWGRDPEPLRMPLIDVEAYVVTTRLGKYQQIDI